nr:hypothetical protein [uncultured Rhodoferax sp.]
MFDELFTRIETLGRELKGGYGGRHAELQKLIVDARSAIQTEFGLMPVWEDYELATAEAYVQSNWLLASLAAIQKAMFVTQLPDEEYWGGLLYTKPDIPRTKRRQT